MSNLTSKSVTYVGLLGGTFNPAHEGHLSISQQAKEILGLDEIWWVVSHNHPQKDAIPIAPFASRLAQARALTSSNNFIQITDIEQESGTSYTIDTLDYLTKKFPYIQFIWLMGADNLQQFHSWHRWQEFLDFTPIAVLDREPYQKDALNSPAAQFFAPYYLTEPKQLKEKTPYSWSYLKIKTHPASSTRIRHKNL